MSRTTCSIVLLLATAYLLLVAGCVSPAQAHRVVIAPPRYEQPWRYRVFRSTTRWHRNERRRPPRRDMRRWALGREDDRGRRWHGYRSE